MQIRFLRDYTVQDEAGKTFKQGQVCNMSEASCVHFVNRGAAEFVTGMETASMAPSETAVRPRGRPRKVTPDAVDADD